MTRSPTRPLTIRMSDVAREAGVALATVSRALNEPHKLSDDTLARVHDTIQRLGYVPNLTAGSLASARSRMVGAIVPALSNTWFAQTLDALGCTLAAHGYELMLAQSRYSCAEEALLADAFLARRVDALVLTAGRHDPALLQRLHGLNLPVVELWDWPDQPIDMVAGYSNLEAGRCVADHFRQRGYGVTGFIGADEERSLKRLQGFRDGMQQWAGPGGMPAVELLPPNSSPERACEAAARLLGAHPHTRAIFCSNDLLAAGVLVHARQAGRDVPQQLAVVGFSDMPIAGTTYPPLSTVGVQPLEMGQAAARLLLNRLQGADTTPPDGQINIGFELKIRGSS